MWMPLYCVIPRTKDGHELVPESKCGTNLAWFGAPEPMFQEGIFPEHLPNFYLVQLFGPFKPNSWAVRFKWLRAVSLISFAPSCFEVHPSQAMPPFLPAAGSERGIRICRFRAFLAQFEGQMVCVFKRIFGLLKVGDQRLPISAILWSPACF